MPTLIRTYDIPFLGRAKDKAHFLGRISKPGLTAIIGPPKRGKTRLMQRML